MSCLVSAGNKPRFSGRAATSPLSSPALRPYEVFHSCCVCRSASLGSVLSIIGMSFSLLSHVQTVLLSRRRLEVIHPGRYHTHSCVFLMASSAQRTLPHDCVRSSLEAETAHLLKLLLFDTRHSCESDAHPVSACETGGKETGTFPFSYRSSWHLYSELEVPNNFSLELFLSS